MTNTHTLLQAMLLLAVDPKLQGLLIEAGVGLGKSVLVRRYRKLLPVPYVELPLNVTLDRLLGGLDLECTLASGTRQVSRGLLARANGGTLYIDQINLLDRTVANQITAALSTGTVHLEREGLSEIHSAEFLLIGTYDPAEGKLAASLLDRIGLFISPVASASPDIRAEIAARVLAKDISPTAFIDEERLELSLWQGVIAQARTLLSQIVLSRNDLYKLSQAAIALGVEGNRADIFAMRVARASAALAGRQVITDEDLEAALHFVLIPRATTLPSTQQNRKPEKESPQQSDKDNESTDELPLDQYERLSAEELIIKALDSPLPEGLLTLPGRSVRRSATGSRGETINRIRGRYVKSVAGKPSEGKIALDATLRAAALHQQTRRQNINAKDRRTVIIKPVDLHLKRFQQKAGALFIFVVDASGSMALHRINQAKGALTRLLQQAYIHRDKVALISFRGTHADVILPPSQSVERAKRALDALPVGGGTPLVTGLLAGLDLARRARRAGTRQIMLLLFTDGRVNVGLHTAEIADRAARRYAIEKELVPIAAALHQETVDLVVVDTENRFISDGAGKTLAKLLGGRYIYLPRISTTAMSDTMADIISETHCKLERNI
ncbi:MAG: magnesium chelatase ATPase subunit D [Acidobacteriota bacterium]